MNQRLPPKSESALLERCREIEGLSFSALAELLSVPVPTEAVRRKGWVGGVIEQVLGTTAGTSAQPDFHRLGIELKTLPIGLRGKPLESTFVTSINLLTIHQESWERSQCYSKLRRVLWLPIEGDKSIDFPHRRIGRGFLWSANKEDLSILAEDWHDLSFMLGRGKLAEVDARMGTYLQVRPKAANARSLCYGFDEDGQKILTLPRGFYLRPSFTEKMLGCVG